MAPHLTPSELDFIHVKDKAGKTVYEICSLLHHRRARQGIPSPDLTNVRNTVKGVTYKCGRKERRG